MYSIGNLCREFNLSRSTLLYYDAIGLLVASERTQGNYRQYSEKDKVRLRKICAFREAGVPLKKIKEILDGKGTSESNILERRLNELNQEIRDLRLKQKIIIEILTVKGANETKMLMDRQTLVSVLQSSGLDEEQMDHFHIELEKYSPDAHQFFLEFLGIDKEKIIEIREFCRETVKKT